MRVADKTSLKQSREMDGITMNTITPVVNPMHVGSGGSQLGLAEFAEELRQFYLSKRLPELAEKVAETAERYQHDQQRLWGKLHRKYGPPGCQTSLQAGIAPVLAPVLAPDVESPPTMGTEPGELDMGLQDLEEGLKMDGNTAVEVAEDQQTSPNVDVIPTDDEFDVDI